MLLGTLQKNAQALGKNVAEFSNHPDERFRCLTEYVEMTGVQGLTRYVKSGLCSSHSYELYTSTSTPHLGLKT